MQQKVGRVRCLLLRQPSHPLQRRATKFECGSCGAISTGVGDGDWEGGHVTQRRFFWAGGETTERRPPAGVTVPVGCGTLDAPAGRTGRRCVGGENFLKRLWPLKAPRGDPSDRRGTGDSSQPKMQCPVVDTGDGRGLSMLPLRFGARPMAGGGGGSFVFSLMAMAEGLGPLRPREAPRRLPRHLLKAPNWPSDAWEERPQPVDDDTRGRDPRGCPAGRPPRLASP